MVGSSFNKQGNLLTRLVLGSLKTKRPPHPPANILKVYVEDLTGLSRWLSGEKSACQCRSPRRQGFYPWIGKIPWSRKWQCTPVFVPGKFHGQRSLMGYSSRGHKELDWATERSHACAQMSQISLEWYRHHDSLKAASWAASSVGEKSECTLQGQGWGDEESDCWGSAWEATGRHVLLITSSSILPLRDRLLQFYKAPWHEVCPELSAWGLTSMEVAQLGVLSCCFGDRCCSNCIDTYKRKHMQVMIFKTSNFFFNQEPHEPKHWFTKVLVRSLKEFTCVFMWFNKDDTLANWLGMNTQCSLRIMVRVSPCRVVITCKAVSLWRKAFLLEMF